MLQPSSFIFFHFVFADFDIVDKVSKMQGNV